MLEHRAPQVLPGLWLRRAHLSRQAAHHTELALSEREGRVEVARRHEDQERRLVLTRGRVRPDLHFDPVLEHIVELGPAVAGWHLE
eukprot:6303402-Alexandrium_andersonii.AAC.1